LATRFLAAYDTEAAGTCLRACRTIAGIHERLDVPATFFIVGKRLEEEGAEYRAVLGQCPLFEVASHTYSHRMLRDHPFCGPAVGAAERSRELRLGKLLVEQTFGRPCLGLRPGCSFVTGLHGDSDLVADVAAAGFRYVSSTAWGPDYTLPAPLVGPDTYAAEGQPGLWELPTHGWHENVLKGHSLAAHPQRLLLWPMPWPEVVPAGTITTPEEEVAINRRFIDRAVALGLPYVSLIWHPWSLGRFDPAMRMLEMTFQYVRDQGLEFATYADEWSRLCATQ
jgi:peptidoglycan/xylan/chitin deacetylase (PgdA/CDA1 family)